MLGNCQLHSGFSYDKKTLGKCFEFNTKLINKTPKQNFMEKMLIIQFHSRE